VNNIIATFDTSVGTLNTGDRIIMEAVEEVIHEIVKDTNIFLYRIGTHSRISPEQKDILKNAKLKIVGGTNLFRMHYTPFISKYNPWKIGFFDIPFLYNSLFLGVGTTVISPSKTNFGRFKKNLAFKYSRYMWNQILAKDIPHSVRDEETLVMLQEIGIKNVINTGCPTIWNLTAEHCKKIPIKKGKDVVLTITGKKSEKQAFEYLKVALNNYNNVYLWPQSIVDYDYLIPLFEASKNRLKVIPSSLNSYDDLLENNDSIDYIGTRLHGGIRALQHKKRTIIIAIDSRALSFRRDFNLPVIDKSELENLEKLINSDIKTEVHLNEGKIIEFKDALRNYILENLN